MVFGEIIVTAANAFATPLESVRNFSNFLHLLVHLVDSVSCKFKERKILTFSNNNKKFRKQGLKLWPVNAQHTYF